MLIKEENGKGRVKTERQKSQESFKSFITERKGAQNDMNNEKILTQRHTAVTTTDQSCVGEIQLDEFNMFLGSSSPYHHYYYYYHCGTEQDSEQAEKSSDRMKRHRGRERASTV